MIGTAKLFRQSEATFLVELVTESNRRSFTPTGKY
jgi:predicted PhzF superfamily epimerase YddE/YHI9